MALIEGATELPLDPELVSDSEGPGTHDRERPFYNPAMQVNRDLSVMLVEAYAKARGRQIDVADVLAGAGARSLRLANEVDADILVHANDGDPNAVATLEKGRTALGIDPHRLQATRSNAHAFLAERRYDVIDIDPFGSPMPLLDGAMRAVRHDGLVCLTATDTAALAGTYPRVCRRRYGAWHGVHKAPWRAEVGLRILAAAAIQSAGRFDRGATPVLSVARGHWMRVVMHVQDGRDHADRAAKGLGAVWMDADRFAHIERDATTVQGPHASPIWTGALHGDVLQRFATDRPMAERTARLVDTLQAEGDEPFWVAMPDLRRSIGRDLPKKPALMQALQDAGHGASPSHIDPEGIRTDADIEAFEALIPPTKQV